jgi:cyclopropane fatty-acyl-phospholipid synthase-like methyltransferase
MNVYPLLFIVLLCIVIIILVFYLIKTHPKTRDITEAPTDSNHSLAPTTQSNVQKVRTFYDQNTDKFIEVYGEVIQAYRTKKIEDYLEYTILNAELKSGLTVLDAGCGIGGPASYFASKLDISIEGITISDIQVAKSAKLLETKTLIGSVNIRQGDYHKIEGYFGKDKFDRILFLESFGHSSNQVQLIEAANQCLKPGGILYIKDLFRREHPNQEDGIKIDNIINEINKAYQYNVADLTEVLKCIRRLNLILISLKTPEVKNRRF